VRPSRISRQWVAGPRRRWGLLALFVLYVLDRFFYGFVQLSDGKVGEIVLPALVVLGAMWWLLWLLWPGSTSASYRCTHVADWREMKARSLAVHSSTTNRSRNPANRRTAAAPMRVHVSSALNPARSAVSRTRRV
jgi:hypothetical protein